MITEFKIALCNRTDLEKLKEELCEENDRQYEEQRKKIANSFRTANFIAWALREDVNTEQYQLARSYLERYSKETGVRIIEPQQTDEGSAKE